MQMFNGMFGKVQNGMCRLSMNGGIAVKTSDGYKTYNVEKNKLTNCSNFVFDIGEEFFFVIPTNKVKKGDISIDDPSSCYSRYNRNGDIDRSWAILGENYHVSTVNGLQDMIASIVIGAKNQTLTTNEISW